jgi:hypothetical protein
VGGVTDFSAKGLGYSFFSWVKETFEDSRVKRSILTTFVTTKAQKRKKLILPISFEGFIAIFAIWGFYRPISADFGYFFCFIRL